MIYDNEKVEGTVHVIVQVVCEKVGPNQRKFHEADSYIEAGGRPLSDVGTVVQQQGYELLREVLEAKKKEKEGT